MKFNSKYICDFAVKIGLYDCKKAYCKICMKNLENNNHYLELFLTGIRKDNYFCNYFAGYQTTLNTKDLDCFGEYKDELIKYIIDKKLMNRK